MKEDSRIVERFAALCLIFSVIAAFNVSCAAPRSIAATEEEREEATNAALICLEKAVPKIDDLRSDASTIAVAAANMCGRQFSTMDDAYFRQENNSVRRQLAVMSPETHLKMALRMVLDFRTHQPQARSNQAE